MNVKHTKLLMIHFKEREREKKNRDKLQASMTYVWNKMEMKKLLESVVFD